MRRIMVVVSAFIFASLIVSFAALAAGAQTTSPQPTDEEPAQQESTTPEPEESAADPEASALGPSQGSLTNGTAGPNEPSLVDDTPPTAAESKQFSAQRKGRASGNDVVRAAKRYIGTKYKHSSCTGSRMSCTCLTKKTWAKFGHKLSMTENGQWKYKRARSVPKSRLGLGDIVFFKEGGRKGGITHVGIYSGRGNLVHASSYFGKVVESKMKYIRGYSGAKTLKPR
jgi:cell wall-associated NlpC family hydrolase